MADRLSVRDRVLVLDHLEVVALYLNRLASYLAEQRCEVEADMTNDAAKALLGVCWWLSRPLRSPPPPEVWKPAGTGQAVPYQQAPDQQR
jgi:hypothetical protein